VALGFGFGPVYQKAGEGNYFNFLVPGIIAMSILFTAMFMGIEIIWDRQFGFLKETLVAPVSRLKIMAGRTLGGATVAVLQGVIVFLISLLIGFRPLSFGHVMLSLLIMFLIAIIFTALGTAIASKMEDMHGFQLIMSFLIMPLFFLSGALFQVKDLNQTLSVVIKVNPLSYGVDALRGTLNNAYSFSLSLDLLVLTAVAVLFLIIGSYLFSKIEI
jgi:ABC-2 type transport system permease protein